MMDVNASMLKAVCLAGLLALTGCSEEKNDPRRLVFEVGTKRYATHYVTVTHTKPRATAPAKELPQVALVIDDFGYARGGTYAEMLAMDMPLTIAVLPTLRHSASTVKRAAAEGRCVLLHLPMEPETEEAYDVPPIKTNMDRFEIARLVTSYLEDVPGVVGVNNHQGSRVTQIKTPWSA